MRILYGVAGEGFGHSSRALVVADYLEKKGHDVVIMTYGRAYKVLKKRFKVFKVKGLHLIFQRSILKKRRTFAYNLENFSKNIRRWKRFHSLMRDFNPDLCISDMEPIVPILRNWYKLPLICLDNQHRITNLRIDVPKRYYGDYLLAKGVVNSFVKRADYFIIASFSKTPILKRNTFIVPPIIREKVRRIEKKRYGKKILVYLTKKDRGVIKILKNTKENFVIYSYNKFRKKGNLEFKTKESFISDLKNCKAIIGTAGFTLISEAIYLDKPYFALPLKGQFEQTLNALFLKKAGFGEYSESLTEREFENFLENLGKYKKKLQKYKPDYRRLFKVLDSVLKKLEISRFYGLE